MASLPIELINVFRSECAILRETNATKLLFVEGLPFTSIALLEDEIHFPAEKYRSFVFQYENKFHRPYAGLLEFISDLYAKQEISFSWGDLEIFEDHKEALHSLLSAGEAVRAEPQMFAHREFEQKEWVLSLATLIRALLEKDKSYFLFLHNLEFAPASTWQVLIGLANELKDSPLLFFGAICRSVRFENPIRMDMWQDFVAGAEESFGIIVVNEAPSESAELKLFPPKSEQLSAWIQTATNTQACVDITIFGVEFGAMPLSEEQECLFILALIDAESAMDKWQSAHDNCFVLIEKAKAAKMMGMLSLAYRRLAILYVYHADPKSAWHYANNSLNLSLKNGSETDRLDALFTAYLVQVVGNDSLPIGSAMHTQLLELAKKHKHETKLAYMYGNMYFDYKSVFGELDKVVELIEESVNICRRKRHKAALVQAYQQLSTVYSYTCDYSRQIGALKQSLVISEHFDDKAPLIGIYNGIGHAYILQEDLQRAFEYFSKALDLVGNISNYNEITSTLFNIANLYFTARSYELAAQVFNRILKVMEILDVKHIPFHSQTKIFALMGICNLKRGAYVKALWLADKIRSADQQTHRGIGEAPFFIELFLGMIDAYNEKYDQAITHFEAAPTFLDQNITSHDRFLPSYYAELGMIYRKMGDHKQAESAFNYGLSISEKIGYERHAAWLELIIAEQRNDNALLDLPPASVDIHYIEELARHQASLNKLNATLKEINFINNIEKLIAEEVEIEPLVDGFLELVTLSFVVDAVFFQLDRFSKKSISHSYPDNISKTISAHRITDYIQAQFSRADLKSPQIISGPHPAKTTAYLPLRGADYRGSVILLTMNQQLNLPEADLNMLQLVASQVCRALEKIDQAAELQQRNIDLQVALEDLDKQHEQLKQLQTQLVQSEKMSSVGTLVAGVAHEMNNPTNFVISGIDNAQLALSELHSHLLELMSPDDTEVKDWLSNKMESIWDQHTAVTEGAVRIVQIVSDLKQFSRLDEAAWQDNVDINVDLSASIRLVENKYRDQLTMRSELAEFAILSCNPSHLNQVFLNVLANACDAVLQAHASPDDRLVHVHSELTDSDWTINFIDNGGGLTNEQIQRAFEPFYTDKVVGQGQGLGLSIAYSIIEQHNGSITLSNNDVGGATATITIPLQSKNIND